jgi:hypothetical protein
MFTTVAQAHTALRNGPVQTPLRQLRLLSERDSPGVARALVMHVCRTWRVPHLLNPARLVMSDLVVNAIEHAGTRMLVSVAQRGSGLHLAVRDGSATMPRIVNQSWTVAAALDQRGQGLRVVDRIARAWGALPVHDGAGKVVWASIRPGRVPRP